MVLNSFLKLQSREIVTRQQLFLVGFFESVSNQISDACFQDACYMSAMNTSNLTIAFFILDKSMWIFYGDHMIIKNEVKIV